MKWIKGFILGLSLLVLLSLIISYWRSVSYQNFDTNLAHHGEDKFISQVNESSPMLKYLKMRYNEGSIDAATEAQVEAVKGSVDLGLINSPAQTPRVTWLGHSTALIQYRDRAVLTDPHLSQHATPIAPFGPKRVVPAALSYAELPKIDYVVISHNHYDHLDDYTVRLIANDVHWYVPLGIKDWLLKRDIDSANITELDWWQDAQPEPGINITFTPARHWSKRTPFDTNKTLWGSWAIKVYDFNTWFGGDTGYDDELFKRIGNELGPFDLGLIPIGAYGPRYFMLPKHMDPEQALLTHNDINAAISVGIHWGTFELTHEPFLEPQTLIDQLGGNSESMTSSQNNFITLKIGETKVLR